MIVQEKQTVKSINDALNKELETVKNKYSWLSYQNDVVCYSINSLLTLIHNSFFSVIRICYISIGGNICGYHMGFLQAIILYCRHGWLVNWNLLQLLL